MGGVQAKPLGLGTLLKNRDLGWHCDVASTEGWSGEVSFSGPTTGLPDKGQSVTQGCISAFFFPSMSQRKKMMNTIWEAGLALFRPS